MTDITRLDTTTLEQADNGSWYTISGAGGDLQEWVNGYTELMTENGIGTPTAWYQTTGESVNRYAEHKLGGKLMQHDAYPVDVTVLLFPLEGLEPKIVLFKIEMQDRWFDDIIGNMRVES